MEVDILNEDFRRKWESLLNIRIIGDKFFISWEFYQNNFRVIDGVLAEALEFYPSDNKEK